MAGGNPWCRHAARGLLGLLSAAALTIVGISAPSAASASNWALVLSASSKAEAHALAGPSAPAGVSAACVSSSSKEITVTWRAVADASTYTVYDSTSVDGTYASKATGETGTTWTGTISTAGNYWFEVAAYVGTKWLSAKSAPSGETTIASSAPDCTQP
ncbi:MAG: hypothetical protein ACLQVK_16800 [Acidimicrobiales bacterium]|jgi:hypothetical protein